MKRIGIFGVSSQTGKAFLSDLAGDNVDVYGYARDSENGREVVSAIRAEGGIQVDRPPNNIGETRRFQPLPAEALGHDLAHLVAHSELLLVTVPSLYHEELARLLEPLLTAAPHRPPLILSPSRTMATPYLQAILGTGYPIVSFQTSPYASKTFSPASVFIKRRKQAWLATLEGEQPPWIEEELKELFPQLVFSRVPAVNALGNIGAVFHPAPYLLNLDDIKATRAAGRRYSFYMDGIAHNPRVGPIIEQIDQIRLQIAKSCGCSVFGLHAEPREEEFAAIMEQLVALSGPSIEDLNDQRLQRAAALQPLESSVVSAQHWLAYTYGVQRIAGESLPDAIARTKNYQSASFPQERYIHEDVPTGLVPFEALAARLDIPHAPISMVIDRYEALTGIPARRDGRNLEPFDTPFLKRYLTGDMSAATLVERSDV